MDYEKKYNDALERARALWREAIEKEYPNDYLKDYETIFPELRESEDERIRKAIVHLLEVASEAYLIEATGFKKEQFLAWLEKQKEQKQTDLPAGFYYIDLNGNRYYSKEFRYGDMKLKVGDQKPLETPSPSVIYTEQGDVLAEQEPAWSEEDEKMLTGIIERGSVQVPPYTTALREEQIEWLMNRLKSLRPQPREEIYQSAKHDLAIKFMNYLDENRPEGKMSLSNGECEDIDKAFKENDWAKIMRYVEKYSPQPKVVWSEEDESILDALIYDIERLPMQGVLTHRPCDSYIKFLKALRPGWKPTEEQMKALQHAIDACESEWAYQDDELRSLLNDLKKL